MSGRHPIPPCHVCGKPLIQHKGIEPLCREVQTLAKALRHISLCSQNSMSSKEDCGASARKALALLEGAE